MRERVRSSFRGGEARRVLVAMALGLALGAVVAVFARREEASEGERGDRWRARSGT